MIKVEKLSFKYGEETVLDNISLELKNNERLCIMGRSGIGKTTLIRILAGLEKNYTGSLEMDLRKTSIVFQEDRLLDDLSPIENVRAGSVRGIYSKCMDEKTEKTEKTAIIRHLSLLSLDKLMNKKTRSLSGGEKRRVAIVRAIMSDSDLVIMDEPFTGLDEDTKQLAIEYIDKYIGDRTLVIVTHNEEDAGLLKSETFCLDGSTT